MENIRMLERHRRRIAFLVALLMFLLIYSIIIIFQLVTAYFEKEQINQQLSARTERVVSVANNYDVLMQTEDTDLISTVSAIIDGSLIFSQKRIISDIEDLDRARIETLDDNTISIENGWKIYKRSFSKDDEDFTVLVGVPYETIFQKLTPTLLLLLFLSPFIYASLAFIACRFMTQIYKPLKEIIMSLESFASNVNHEFKTSLTEIISSLELAKVTKEYEEANKHSIGSARRLDNILNSLGSMIHFVDSDYRKERINIIAHLDSSLDDFSKLIADKNITLSKKYDPDKAIFRYIDTPPLTLCFQNILENAIKYSDNGGEIEISIHKNGFTIMDYGAGISEENLSKIFDRYFREGYTKSGSGIGLSIIKKITEIYNWSIKVKSKKGKYTQVTLKF